MSLFRRLILPESHPEFGALYAVINDMSRAIESLSPRPSFRTLTGWSGVGVSRQGLPGGEEGEPGEPTQIGAFVVRAVHGDYLECRAVDDLDGGGIGTPRPVLIAKPPELRVSNYATGGALNDGVTYSEITSDTRKAKFSKFDTQSVEREFTVVEEMWPPYVAEPTDLPVSIPARHSLIFAAKVGPDETSPTSNDHKTGVTVNGQILEWLDLNVSARHYRTPYHVYAVCVDGDRIEYVAFRATPSVP